MWVSEAAAAPTLGHLDIWGFLLIFFDFASSARCRECLDKFLGFTYLNSLVQQGVLGNN